MGRRRRLLLLVVAVVSAGALLVGCCTPQLIDAAMIPGGEFDPALVPAAPRYDVDSAWLAATSTRASACV